MIQRENKYKKIANKLIRQLPEFEYIRESEVRIVFLSSDEEKKKDRIKLVMADCRKVNKQYEWCCHYDFMITVYEPNIITLDDEQLEILIRHELHHVGIDQEGAEPVYYVVPHDVEEFDDIINEHGLYWQEDKNAERRQSE